MKLDAHLGADFKIKDWLNIGGKIEASQEISAEVPTAGVVSLPPNTKTRPYIRYTVRTQWKAVDHYILSGWQRDPSRTDGKVKQGADLALRIPDDLEALWQGPLDIATSPSDPA